MIISVVDRTPLPPREAIAAALQAEFGAAAVQFADADLAGAVSEYRLTVDPVEGSHFEVWGTRRGSLDLDGTAEQNARAASAVAALLPSGGARVVAVDADRNAYVDLVPGITAAEVDNGWRDISLGGF